MFAWYKVDKLKYDDSPIRLNKIANISRDGPKKKIVAWQIEWNRTWFRSYGLLDFQCRWKQNYMIEMNMFRGSQAMISEWTSATVLRHVPKTWAHESRHYIISIAEQREDIVHDDILQQSRSGMARRFSNSLYHILRNSEEERLKCWFDHDRMRCKWTLYYFASV